MSNIFFNLKGPAKSLSDILKDSQTQTERVVGMIGGFGENMEKFADAIKLRDKKGTVVAWKRKEIRKELRVTRPSPAKKTFDRNDLTRRPVGRNFKRVKVDGEIKYR